MRSVVTHFPARRSPARRSPAGQGMASAVRGWAAPRVAWVAVAALVLLGLLQQVRLGLDCDVAWLLTVGERMLDGARLYRDVVEVNPPASVLLYLPAILAGRAIGLGPDGATIAAVFLLAIGSIAAAGRLLTRDGPIAPRQAAAMAVAGAFALLVLPGACFAQREHVAVLLALPALAVIARRADGRAVSRRVALLAGLAGGVAIAIKPHFALAAALPLAVLGAESLAAGAVVAGYALVVLTAFPEYLAMLPTLRAAYLPLREDPVTLLRGPVVALPLALAGIGWWVRGGRVGSVPAVLGAAAAGFAIAGVVQGKGYLNHAYPGAALGLLALAAILSDAAPVRRSRGVALAAAALLAVLEWHAFAAIAGHPGLAEAVRRVAPPHPRVMALSTELGLGEPLVRRVGGRWVGRDGSLWAAGGAEARLAAEHLSPREHAALVTIDRADEAGFVADVRRGRPDVLLIDATLPGWRARPAVAAVLRDYLPAARVGDAAVWTRRPAG